MHGRRHALPSRERTGRHTCASKASFNLAALYKPRDGDTTRIINDHRHGVELHEGMRNRFEKLQQQLRDDDLAEYGVSQLYDTSFEQTYRLPGARDSDLIIGDTGLPRRRVTLCYGDDGHYALALREQGSHCRGLSFPEGVWHDI